MTRASAWTTIRAFAGSRNLSVFVLVMSITYVLILAVFGVLVDDRWLDIIAGLYPFRLLYALFFLNLIALGIGWVPVVRQRCQRAEPPERAENLGRLEHATQVPGTGLRVEDLKRYLRRRGFQVPSAAAAPASDTARHASVFYASRGRFSLVGNLLFHAGFLLLLAGAATNALYRFEGSAIVAEGDSFRGAKEEYRTIADSAAALPEVDFDVEKISAEFWQGRLFFTGLEAQLLHRGGRDIAELSSAARVGDADITISGFGYAPLAVLKDGSGEIVARARVRLNIFPAGSEDYFYVPGYPHKIHVSFYPDHAQVDGKIVNRSMNPVNPVYFLRILRGRLPVFTGAVKPGAWAEFDGMSISFPSFVQSGDFHIVRNPGHPFIWTAFIVMGLGLAWRLLFYRKEIALWQDDAGRTWLSGRFDYYPKLNAGWLASLAENFKGESA
ncbi:MAG: cytochrome c biogenesis protein ResB [Gammaproteobacteria bacterium]|nr:cytochrome c biogenesis protein ResB [Gammaproteobacteria bacterium]